jgi:gliding motility-associated-like protein
VKSFLAVLLMAMLCILGNAQLTVEADLSVEQYLIEHLVGPGLDISNISFNGQSASSSSIQCAYFNSEYSNVGLSEGLMMSTGLVSGAVGPNNDPASTAPALGLGIAGDVDLDILSDLDTHDAAVLEFDITPLGDSLAFRFVFASEEYPEFANTIYNDVFGFFLSGPGITGPYSSPLEFPNGSINLAQLPDTEIPISINNINNGDEDQGPCEFCEYLISNPPGSDPTAVQFDGLLVPITVKYPVECGETYHLKLAVADVGDDSYDSAIFFENRSLQTNASYEYSISSVLGQGPFYEGCHGLELTVARPAIWSHVETLQVIAQGTASLGVDYTGLPASLTFEQGSFAQDLNLDFDTDELAEGEETIELSLGQEICSAMTMIPLAPILLSDPPLPLQVSYEASTVDCLSPIEIEVLTSGGLGNYHHQWSDGQSGPHITCTPQNIPYLLTSDTCTAPVLTLLDIELPLPEPISSTLPESISLLCGQDSVTLEPVIVGGAGDLSIQWSFDDELIATEETLAIEIGHSGTVSLMVQDECQQEFLQDIPVEYEPYESLNIQITGDGIVCTGADTEVLASVSGGVPPFEYSWSHDEEASGPLTLVNTLEPTTIQVQVQDACHKVDQASKVLELSQVHALFMVEELNHFDFQTLNMSSSTQGSITEQTWYMDGSSIGEETEAYSEFWHNGEHRIELTVENEYGCSDTFSLKHQPGPLLHVPSAFSPDGDGLNDTFEIVGLAIEEFELVIFDRKGKSIFRSDSLNSFWDGSDPGHPNGSYDYYLYLIRATGKNGEEMLEKGAITLIR